MRYENILDRIASNSVMGDEITYAGQRCWLYCGSVNKEGYGRVSKRIKTGTRKGKVASHYVHRISHRLLNNKRVRKGYCVRHHCNVRCCWNPAHLQGGTSKQNTKDMLKAKRHWSGFRGPKPGRHEPELQRMRAEQNRARSKLERFIKQQRVVIDTTHIDEDIPL